MLFAVKLSQVLAFQLSNSVLGGNRAAYSNCAMNERPIDFPCPRCFIVIARQNVYVDMIVAEAVVVELKAVDQLAPVHYAQLLTYLRLGGWKLGLLINFNVKLLKEGIKRIAV